MESLPIPPDLDLDSYQAKTLQSLSRPFMLLTEELLRWNQVHNLSGHSSPDQVVVDLILDSLYLAPQVRGTRILDIGSGAGFPGLVLALALPGTEVTLLEPRSKRVSFMQHAVRILELGTRVEVIKGRAEESGLAKPDFDTVTVRAVGSLKLSLALAQPYLAKNGLILLPRGIKDQGQAEALGLKVIPYDLPQPYGRRIIVLAPASCFT
ncbi:MAG: 16S rRNA (guanine(527)-N(7))-methyltransferase RsmG [Desulfarculaceae bacterium]|jgi:16S rRNA (guanine527-N7)-methyltransferase